MYEASACKPDAEKLSDKVTETDAVRCLEDVEILEYIWNRHQPESSREPQTCHRIDSTVVHNFITQQLHN